MTAMEFCRDFREPTPRVLIMDLRLPGITGVELQDKLEETDNVSHLIRIRPTSVGIPSEPPASPVLVKPPKFFAKRFTMHSQ